MSPITHFLMGWAVANAVPSLGKRDRALVTWAGVVPDIDGLGIIADGLTRNSRHPLHLWGDYHHILCHNVGFAIVIVAQVVIFAKQRVIAALLGALSFHLHLLSDLIGVRGPDGDQWPIPYLLPFSKSAQLIWSGQWALNAWQNFVITGVLIGIMLIFARQRRFSPLEIVSARADDIFCPGVAGAVSFETRRLKSKRVAVGGKQQRIPRRRHDSSQSRINFHAVISQLSTTNHQPAVRLCGNNSVMAWVNHEALSCSYANVRPFQFIP